LAWFKLSTRPRTPTSQQLAAAFPDNSSLVFQNSQQFTLLSLDWVSNGHYKGPDSFHGYRILGKTPVSKGVKAQLITAFYDAMTDTSTTPMACFRPRHGIRAVHKGKAVDLVICFECHLFVVIPSGKDRSKVQWPLLGNGGNVVSNSAQSAFDRALTDAGVPLNAQ
jgi:hypothetical protein